MNELIISALHEAKKLIDKQAASQTNRLTNELSINEVIPSELNYFIKENNIPFNSYFDFDCDKNEVLICWDIEDKLSEKERLEYKKRRFPNVAYSFIFKNMVKAGFNRTAYNVKEQTDILNKNEVYEAYLKKDFDKLVNGYSIMFKK